MWRNPGEIPNNGLDDDQNGFVDDVFGYDFLFDNGVSIGELLFTRTHGSHSAGIIAGRHYKKRLRCMELTMLFRQMIAHDFACPIFNIANPQAFLHRLFSVVEG
jgi:hypothetical protein